MKKTLYQRLLALALIAFTVVPFWSCNKDEHNELTFTSPALYFSNFGSTQSIAYRSTNVGSVRVSEVPEGWSAEIDTKAKIVTITAPVSLEEKDDVTPKSNGILKLTGYGADDEVVIAQLYVALTDVVDYTSNPSNCYVINRPNIGYMLSATHVPQSNLQIDAESVEVLWTTSTKIIQYLDLTSEGTISFMVAADESGKLIEGNVLLGVFDTKGNLAWTFHLWISDLDLSKDVVAFNGKEFIARNLGAMNNTTATQDEILRSYGLYYQWGRPTPFAGPKYYNCASADSASMYDGDGVVAKVETVDAQSQQWSLEEAIVNPLEFVTNLSSWDITKPWSDDEKSMYDPCPEGWRVPQSGTFDGVSILEADLNEGIDALCERYGWHLTDGANSEFFFAGGRRTYLDGKIVNMNTEETPKPWVGFYWTCGEVSSLAESLFFDLNTTNISESALQSERQVQLSNGLQIRCVRE